MSRTTRPAPGRGYHHGQLRETLIEAALQLARTGGPEAVVLRAVSREAQVSHNAAYRHFADHDDLLAAVGDRCMARLAALMTERTAQVTARAPVKRARARLGAIGRAYIEFATTEPGWFRTAFAAHPHPPDAPGATPRKGEPPPEPGPYDLLNARLDELVEVGAIPARRRPGAEYAAWSAVHGLSALLVEGPLRQLPAAETERAVDAVLAVVDRGL